LKANHLATPCFSGSIDETTIERKIGSKHFASKYGRTLFELPNHLAKHKAPLAEFSKPPRVLVTSLVVLKDEPREAFCSELVSCILSSRDTSKVCGPLLDCCLGNGLEHDWRRLGKKGSFGSST
jgi:hypothetical protein